MYVGIGNRVVYGFYPHFIRPFMYPYIYVTEFSEHTEVSSIKYTLYFDAPKFFGFYLPGIKLYILQSMHITFYSSLSTYPCWLEIHHRLVQAVKIPKKCTVFIPFFSSTTAQRKSTENSFIQ